MATLQRSATTFRRSGSSGLVWNERFFSGELARPKNREVGAAPEFSEPLIKRHKGVVAARAATRGSGLRISTAAGNGGRDEGLVATTDPPSPKVPACLCYGFNMGKHDSNKRARKRRI